MDKKDFLQQKYEEINRLKISIQDYPKEYVDNILKSISKVCDEITEHLDIKDSKEEKDTGSYDDNYIKVEQEVGESKEYEENQKDKHNNKKRDNSYGKKQKRVREEVIFTVDELAEFNGMDGNPPYVAVDGAVYDLSRISKWKNGKHYGMIAGQVLTEEYYKCHEKKINLIKKAMVVGKLREETRAPMVFTKEELSKYDGKNGMPPYAAVDGVVYDLTGILQWNGGMHYGLMAGQDLTAYFSGCHAENLDILKNGKEVGTLEGTRQVLPRYTIEELSKFNGVGGELAYVAINGTIYDVTSIKKWQSGTHYGLMAGKDLTEFFNSCHKNEQKILDKLIAVGTLADS